MRRNTLNSLMYLLALLATFSLTSCEDAFDDMFDKDDEDDCYDDRYDDDDEDDVLLNISDLPASILDFVRQNYPNTTIVQAEYERDGREAYEITLSNGIELYFDESGDFLYQDDDDDDDDDCDDDHEQYGDDDDQLVNVSELPQPILDYVTQNFPNTTIIRAEYDRDDRETYEITLANGVELYFDANGDFIRQEQDNRDDQAVALEDLPQEIRDYVTQNYPNLTIIRAVFDTDERYYEIMLSNGLELYFDENGGFLRFD